MEKKSLQSVEQKTQGLVINSDSKVVLVLGAGASISEVEYHNLSRPKTPFTVPPSDQKFMKQAESLDKKQFNAFEKRYKKLWNSCEPYPIKYQRMEQIFSSCYSKFITTDHRKTSGKNAVRAYDTLVKMLEKVLIETTTIKKAPEQHLRVFERIYKAAKELTIFDFNYDVFADRALAIGDKENVWSWNISEGYGFEPEILGKQQTVQKSKILLLKLHGSMNWYVETSPKDREVPFPQDCHPYIPVPGGTYTRKNKNGTLPWVRKRRIKGHDKSKQVYPIMIPPVFEKSNLLGGEFKRIWEEAEKKLLEADLVIFWGYSMPITDYHSESLFARTARSRLYDVAIINTDREISRIAYVSAHRWLIRYFKATHFLEALSNSNP